LEGESEERNKTNFGYNAPRHSAIERNEHSRFLVSQPVCVASMK